jgi:2-amino-4-hydroxy-6-hydroxymethyldihydropteridine diphosphokinase
MVENEKTVLLLGSNIEPRKAFIADALALLREEFGSEERLSGIYESEPWGFDAQVPFLNRVVVFETGKTPQEVLGICLDVEQKLGRKRKDGSGFVSRTIDVDVLYFGNKIVETKNLTIPHPALHLRRFTLLPLVEVIPGFVHPVLKKDNKALLNECADNLNVVLFEG